MENNESKYVLVKFSDNWADEMDIEGVEVVPRDDFYKIYNLVKEVDHEFEINIGTNEDLFYDDGSDFLKHVKVTNIDEDFANKYYKFVGDVGFVPYEMMREILMSEGTLPEDEYEDDDFGNEDEDGYEDEDEVIDSILHGVAIGIGSVLAEEADSDNDTTSDSSDSYYDSSDSSDSSDFGDSSDSGWSD
jgi:hypothetical protein